MKKFCLRTIVILLSLVLLLGSAGTVQKACAAGKDSLTLSEDNLEANQSFQLENMVPGQVHTQQFRLEIVHKKAKSVGFRASVSEGSKKLADALMVTVKNANTGEVLYDDALTSMSWVNWKVTKEKVLTLEELVYEVSVSLPNDAGEDYLEEKVNIQLDWRMGPGRSSNIFWLWFFIILGVLLLGAFVVAFILLPKTALPKQTVRIVRFALPIAALILCWGVISYSLSWHQITVDDNTFSVGTLEINLNDGKPVFDKEVLIEPGMMLQEYFTIKNVGSANAYYRLWFSEIEGDLANELMVEIRDGKKLIFEGEFAELLEEKAFGTNSALMAGEEKELSIVIFLPEEGTNAVQGDTITFRLNYDATQMDGNPGKEYA